jgi:hypothetical protein
MALICAQHRFEERRQETAAAWYLYITYCFMAVGGVLAVITLIETREPLWFRIAVGLALALPIRPDTNL